MCDELKPTGTKVINNWKVDAMTTPSCYIFPGLSFLFIGCFHCSLHLSVS